MTGAVAVTRLFPAAWSWGCRGKQSSRAEPRGPMAMCSQICAAHSSAPQCCRGVFRDIITGTRWVLLWMVVAEEAWGPRAARVGPEGLRNVFTFVELPLHADNQNCRLQISSPSVAATYKIENIKGQEPHTFQISVAVLFVHIRCPNRVCWFYDIGTLMTTEAISSC